MIFALLGGGVYSKGAFIRGGAFILKSEILGGGAFIRGGVYLRRGVYSRKYGILKSNGNIRMPTIDYYMHLQVQVLLL